MHLRMWLFGLLLLCLCVSVAAADDTTCSATKRCKNGCCNKAGNCGFGPDYCGSTCRSDCDRKSECNPGFGSKWAASDKCPLNVCCSKHGYCGTTKDFCGTKQVKRPSCSKNRGVDRVVGYFEGWARSRPCQAFWPEQIPIGLYTHINFAFATINPKTFIIEKSSQDDPNTYERLVALKEKDADLKIYLAIGGWSFSDPGKTHTTFSDLAASLSYQDAFIESLQSFISTWDFDGLDLDWEYPVDKDRGGRSVDFANFPKFMSRLKKVLDGGDKGLTLTLPASYWYLKYFDIKKLEKYVDFFNIMSYDLHGAWDQKGNWTKPYLNAHTNLTEIDLALDLLWRNDIHSDNVVLGMGFYGRAFTVQDLNCKKPGCLFKDAGRQGECSVEAGILLNSEIDGYIKKHDAKVDFYKEEAVKVAQWGNQWVAYDDEETLKMKTEFAQSRCLGGVMVWAISHDTKDAKYNMALAKALGRRTTRGSLNEDEQPEEYKRIPHDQCRWTNCNEACPKGWVWVPRSDPDARDNEKMWDDTGCGGDGGHNFCCPATYKLPTCGWWGHNGGKCGKGNLCPNNMVEIGSNQIHCTKRKQTVQSACCTTEVDPMKVYRTCEWGAYPDCDSQEGCPAKGGDSKKGSLLAFSASGSGGGKCNQKKNELGLNVVGVQLQKYCCDDRDDNLKFHDCQPFKDVGPFPRVKNLDPYYCRSGCPPDRIRVALDTEAEPCSYAGIGGLAICCKFSYGYEVTVENPKLTAMKGSIKEWVDNPTCPHQPGVFNKRFIELDGMSANASMDVELLSRRGNVDEYFIQYTLGDILNRVGSPDILAAAENEWDALVKPVFPQLTIRNIKRYLGIGSRWENEGPDDFANRILCSPYTANARILVLREAVNGNDGKSHLLNCTYAVCDKDGNCGDLDKGLDKRHHGFSHHRSAHLHEWIHARQVLTPTVATVELKAPNGDRFRLEYEVPGHDPVKRLPSKHPGLKNTAEFEAPDDCSDWRLKPRGEWTTVAVIKYQTEHPIDKSMMKAFFLHAAAGTLGSGGRPTNGPIPIIFFENMPGIGELPRYRNGYTLISGKTNLGDGNLFNRIMECLGSREHDANFIVTERTINRVKGVLMQHHLPLEYKDRLEVLRDRPVHALGIIRASIATFDYLDTRSGPNVWGKTTNVLQDIYNQLVSAQAMWELENPDNPVNIVGFFIEWVIDWYETALVKAQDFVRITMAEMRNIYEEDGTNPAMAKFVLETLDALEQRVGRMHVDTNWPMQFVTP
ncbi:hypothetical protein FIE12Z_12577 [Fusarium flagelliforme]|uniref:chitinase n=1 Tax=Fusarium flagelliforme TaxID=2675880 RepID=A0A395M5P2_9HYPO|nr:hypothetical protein FIE12Z_12577 [Fusarium flagelliforme]